MNAQKRKNALFQRLQNLGFTYGEAASLRRIEMTLHRWSELECGDGNEWGSWAIERDPETEKPSMIHHHYGHGRRADSTTRTPIADREGGALKRCKVIVDARNARVAPDSSSPVFVTPYQQTDPRGCALYMVRGADLCGLIDSCYSRGIAVCS